MDIAVERRRRTKLEAFQAKLASLAFLDPACGSGNFLTETYLSLRRLENEVISALHHDQITLDIGNPTKVSIGQFYGIEINDFAVTVARTALWIAESQMMRETEDVVHMSLDFLPLRSYANITEGNALRLDRESVVDKTKLNYIMGNPPFVGGMMMTKEQKAEINTLFSDVKGSGELDYVSGWYIKAVNYMRGTNIQAAFVSTNSIRQGQQATTLWKPINAKGVRINFAYRTFVWDSEASIKARVHCIVVGFSFVNKDTKYIYDGEKKQIVENINSHLIDAPHIFIESCSKPRRDVPPMRFGSMPRDGGGFILTDEEKAALLRQEPLAHKWIRPYIGAYEFTLLMATMSRLTVQEGQPCRLPFPQVGSGVFLGDLGGIFHPVGGEPLCEGLHGSPVSLHGAQAENPVHPGRVVPRQVSVFFDVCFPCGLLGLVLALSKPGQPGQPVLLTAEDPLRRPF